MVENKGVLVLGEIAGRDLTVTSKELLSAGRKLADSLGEPLTALFLGRGLEETARKAISFGVEKVYLAGQPSLNDYHPEFYTTVVSELCRRLSPSVVLMGQTDVGRDLAPRLAARLGTGLCMDCIDLSINERKLLVATRPVFGGNALATKVIEKTRPQIVTVRPRSFSAHEPSPDCKGEIIPHEVKLDESAARIKVLNRVREEAEGVKLEEAEVIVTGGRGLGGKEGFTGLNELARLLRGAVGGTRAACEEGWLPTSQQVGQTGKIVAPNLYVAIAVSGAMQHLAGCSGSKNIVAINRDPDANIFRVARFGVVADYRQAVPALIAKIKELIAA